MPNEHCQSVRDRLGAYATNGLNDSERADVEAHLASCSDCAAQVERLRRAAASLAPLRDEIADPKLSAKRRRQILEGKSSEGRSVPKRRLHGLAYRPAVRWAAAAGIAAVTGLAVGHWLISSRDATPMAARESTPSADKSTSEIIAAESEVREEPETSLIHEMDLQNGMEAAPPSEEREAGGDARAQERLLYRPTSSKPPDSEPTPSDAPSAEYAKSAEPGPAGEKEGGFEEERASKAKEMRVPAADEVEISEGRATFAYRQQAERTRRTNKKLEERDGTALAQEPLAEVVAVPSPFRGQHVLLGVRAGRAIDGLDAAGQSFDNLAEIVKSEDDTLPRSFAKAEAGWTVDGDRQTSEPMPVRIRFNEQTVRSQRQIAGRSRHGGKTRRRSADFDAVYEVDLKTAATKDRETAAEADTQLNVATLESGAPRQPLTQQINVASPDRAVPGSTRMVQAAQTHPELYLDACEDELERLGGQSEFDSKNGRQAVLHQVQAILQAVVEVRPEDPRPQSLLERVNRRLVPAEPALQK